MTVKAAVVDNLWWEDEDLCVKTMDGITTRYVGAWFTGRGGVAEGDDNKVILTGATFQYVRNISSSEDER